MDGWEVVIDFELLWWRLRFCFLQLGGDRGARPRFQEIAEGAKIMCALYESTYLHVEASTLYRRPRRRYGFKIARYRNEDRPTLRAWWGTWKSKRSTRPLADYEGELLAYEVSKGPGEPWREDAEA